jgi:hypothetical protein
MTATVFDYADLLRSIRQVAPEAHIAGGAVRDTILQKPIRDVDVFLAGEGLQAVAAHLRSAHGYVMVGEWKEYLGFSDPAMTRVAKFDRADVTIPVCLIGLKPDYVEPADNMARFDFGLCMAAFDGTEVIRTAAFNDDAAARTFTLCRADDAPQFAYSMSRFEKLTADRYAGWKLAVPAQFAELAKGHAMRRHWYQDGNYWVRRDAPKLGAGPQLLHPKDRSATVTA